MTTSLFPTPPPALSPAPGPSLGALAALAASYAESRDPADLDRLWTAVRRAPDLDPLLDLETSGRRLLAAGAHADLLALVRDRMPGAFLSPSAHALLAAAHAGLGEEREARRERRTARLALEAILATGDGSAARPWRVLRVADEYAVLRARGRRSRTQRLVVRDGRPHDVHACDDGSTAWFDLGDARGGVR